MKAITFAKDESLHPSTKDTYSQPTTLLKTLQVFLRDVNQRFQNSCFLKGYLKASFKVDSGNIITALVMCLQ